MRDGANSQWHNASAVQWATAGGAKQHLGLYTDGHASFDCRHPTAR
jgi:hypothetical protein